LKTLIFILLLAFSTTCYANIEAINFSNFPDDQRFQDEVNNFFEIAMYVDHYTPEWKYPIAKEVLVDQLKKLEKQTAKKISLSPKNIDLRLFQVLLLHYLYNLHEIENFNKIKEKIASLKKDFPYEYRPYWLYGKHLAQAAVPVAAVNEYKYVLNIITDKTKLHPAFLEDYAEACYFSNMFKSALDALEIASRIRNEPINSYNMYKSLKKAFIVSNIDGKYEKNDCWIFIKSGDQYVILSRMLGLNIPVNKTWKVNYADYQKRKTALFITPDEIISKKGKNIGISIAIFPSTEEITFDEFINSFIKKSNALNKGEKIISGQSVLIYEYSNPEIYQNIGGSHGYYAFLRLPYPKQPGIKIEVPSEIINSSEQSGQVRYFAVKDIPDRFKHDVYICIMLDSCNEIFEESKKLYFESLGKMIFE